MSLASARWATNLSALRLHAVRRGTLAVLALGLLWVAWDGNARTHPKHQAVWLPAGDVALRVLQAGRGDTTLLLLHGWGESLMSYRAVFDLLARDYHVVAVDLPGFGLSDKPAGPYDLPTMTGRLESFLDAWVPGPVVVVGHSMGGEIAAALALKRPERIVAVVLIAPAGYALASWLANPVDIGTWLAGAVPSVLPVHDPRWLGEPPERAAYDPATDSAYRAAAARMLREFDFAALRERFGELRQPTLLIWGEDDPTIPLAVGQRIASLLPCGRLITMANTLHRPHQVHPEATVQAIETFLAARSPCGPATINREPTRPQ